MSRCSSQELGSFSQDTGYVLSDVHRCFKTCRKSLLVVPSTNLFTHSEYAATVYNLHALDVQKSLTISLLECFLPSAMNVSGTTKVLEIDTRLLMVIMALLAVLYLNT